MKQLLFSFAASAALLGAAELAGVHAVYMLPMAKGLDQYLANRLTNEGIFQVVTDPAKADAFFTDRIGESFEQKLSEVLPPPEEPKPADAQKSEDAKKTEAAKVAARGDVSPLGPAVNKLAKPGSMSFARGRGNVFLVDAKSRLVVWSAYQPASGSDSQHLDRSASQLVKRLKADLKK